MHNPHSSEVFPFLAHALASQYFSLLTSLESFSQPKDVILRLFLATTIVIVTVSYAFFRKARSPSLHLQTPRANTCSLLGIARADSGDSKSGCSDLFLPPY